MANKLKTLKIGFGESQNSPIQLSAKRMDLLLRVINDSTITQKNFSGYVTCEQAIKGSVAYFLGLNGINYVGSLLHEDFSVSTTAEQVDEGADVDFAIEGVPSYCIGFSISGVTITEGSVDEEYVKSLITFKDGKMVVANGTNNDGWIASVNVLAKPKYESDETYTMTLVVKGGIVPRDFALTEELTFKSVGTKTMGIIVSPSNYTVPIKSISASLVNASDVVAVDSYERTIQVSVTDIPNETEDNVLRVTLTPERGNAVTKEFPLSVIVTPYSSLSVLSDGAEVDKLVFGSVASKALTFNFLPSDSNVPIASVEAAFGTATQQFSLSSATKEGVAINCDSLATLEHNTIVITATDVHGGKVVKEIAVENPVVPSVSLEGDVEFTAPNGNGSADYTFKYEPSEYNASVELVSVTSSNSAIKVSNATKDGFKLSVSGTTAVVSGTITAIVKVDGVDKTLTKSVSVTYKEVIEYEAVDLQLPSGRLWANMNVGANKPEAYGQYFQWGDIIGYGNNTSDGKAFSWASYKYCNGSNTTLNKYNNNSSYGSVDNKVTLETMDDAATANMGEEWRMPDEADFNELLDTANCTKVYTSVNGVNGWLFTSVRNGKTLFFPCSGCRSGSSLSSVGSGGYVWSRSLNASVARNGRFLDFNSSSCDMGSNGRCSGYSVRGVQ